MNEFSQRDPNLSAFWDERFEKAFMPWDSGGILSQFRGFVDAIDGSGQAAPPTLIPGCGNAYEVGFLAARGWPVCAIDFSPAAVASARQLLGDWKDCVQEADFFSFQPPVAPQLIIERAFFCALPPAQRSAIIARWAELLTPGGLLAGYFLFDPAAATSRRGPPFAIEAGVFAEAMAECFDLQDSQPAPDSLPVFAGREHWMVWRRK